MAEIVSFFIGTVILYAFFIQIREYNDLIRAKFRFRFFSLRDRLAMLVATGKLEEDSWEYKHVVDTLNFHISAVERMSIMRVVDMLVRYHTSPREAQRVQVLSRQIKHNDVALIMVDYMTTTYDLIKRNSRAQINLFKVAARILKLNAPAVQTSQRVVINPDTALATIESHKSVFQAHLAAA